MRVAIADNNNRKFTGDLIQHWEKKGHDVKFETGASEKLAQWADVYFVDTWDNNIHYLWKLYHAVDGVSRTDPWDNNRKPRIFVRALDWEVWIGLMRDQAIIDWVDGIIFIAKHIQEKVNEEVKISNEKQRLIRPGVNLERFTLKQKQTDGFQLGMVLGDMWKYKNHMAGLDIFTTLYQQDNLWRLHVRGQHENGMYDPVNWEYYLRSRGIEKAVILYQQVDNMNDWYENIDILLHPGQKEAFCYAVAEAMAKGIPVVLNDFLGSNDIWNGKGAYIYKTHAEAVGYIKDLSLDRHGDIGYWKYICKKAHEYIQDTYSAERMFKEMDAFL